MGELEDKNLSRRCFVRGAVMGLFAVPFISIDRALAAGCKPDKSACKKGLLDKKDRRYKKYAYTVDAKTAQKHIKFKPHADCGNCNFYKIKSEVNGNAPCAMFGQKCVVTCGWCNKWIKSKRYTGKAKKTS